MKRVLIFTAIIISILLMSCKTAPSSSSDSSSSSGGAYGSSGSAGSAGSAGSSGSSGSSSTSTTPTYTPIARPTVVDDSAFTGVYSRYRTDLILDGAQYYTVVAGDSLNAIARQFYGSGYYYPVIMLASSDVVQDPDKIQPGMRLTIPNLTTNLANARAKASINGVILDCAVLEDARNRGDTAAGLRNLAGSL